MEINGQLESNADGVLISGFAKKRLASAGWTHCKVVSTPTRNNGGKRITGITLAVVCKRGTRVDLTGLDLADCLSSLGTMLKYDSNCYYKKSTDAWFRA